MNKLFFLTLFVTFSLFAVDSNAKKGEPNYDIEELRPISRKENNASRNYAEEVEVKKKPDKSNDAKKAKKAKKEDEQNALSGGKEPKSQMSSKQLMQATKVKGGEKIKQKIEVRDSSADDGLGNLKDKLYPSGMPKAKSEIDAAEKIAAAKKLKERLAEKSSVPENSERDRQKVLSSLIYMTPDELDKIKKNQVAKTKMNTQLSKEQQQKIIGETEKFYESLKDMSPEQRESYVSERGKF